MSSNSHISISLQSNAASNALDTRKSSESTDLNVDSRQEVSFANEFARAQSDQLPKGGNELPKEDEMPKEGFSRDNLGSVDTSDVEIQQVGALNLVVVSGSSTEISDQSLIEFMQDQGFSRADMAQLLMAKRESSSVQPTAAWLKMKGDDFTNDELQGVSETAPHRDITASETKPKNLADALVAQLINPANAKRSSPILEIFALKDVPQRLATQAVSEVSDQTTIKLTELMPSLSRRQLGNGASNPGGSGDSGIFSGNQRDSNSSLQPSSGPEIQEFRELLAEHLKRAESLRELTDRLGTMIAKQMSGQIGRGRWNLEIAMHPAELGSIEIEMEMTERGLEASFRASQAITRDLLMESMPRLKSWFEEGGIDVAYSGLAPDSGGQNGENSTDEDNTRSETQTAESGESPNLSDSQIVSGDSMGLDIRV